MNQPRSCFAKRLLFIAALVLVACAICFAQRRERLIESWQPTRFDIKLVFDKHLTRLDSAETTVTVLVRKSDLSMIDLDFGTMPVSSVKVDNRNARFTQHDGKLDVYLSSPQQKGRSLNIKVTYSGIPADGLILSKDKDGNPSAIGDNWPDRVHNWIPCLDHPSAKATVRFTVTAPREYVTVANGFPVAMTEGTDGTKKWVFNEVKPISPYNMVVAMGRFASGRLKQRSSIPVSYYVPQSDGKYAERAFAAAVPSVVTFSNLVGPYPYRKLALIVGATRFGGMENANTIVFMPTFFENFLTAERKSLKFNIPANREELEAHEIAHQWFGDSVTESTWADLWLSEGFATYFAGLFLEKNESAAAFREYMNDKAKSYFEYEKQRRAPIFDAKTESLMSLLNPNNYEKGAWVLHGLRGLLGDRAFFAGLRLYYQRHKESTASTEDLRTALQKTSRKDLRSYFQRWIYQSGHPVYKASWRPVRNGVIEISLAQLQTDEAFPQPVTLAINTISGSRRVVVKPIGKETKIVVTSANPKSLIVDPDNFILKEVVD